MSEYFEGISKDHITGNPPRDLLWVYKNVLNTEEAERQLASELALHPDDQVMTDELFQLQNRLDHLYHRLGIHAGIGHIEIIEPKLGKHRLL
jgi:hypothetical protein